jgi:hypothetical protein
VPERLEAKVGVRRAADAVARARPARARRYRAYRRVLALRWVG